jgi:hypothetical protein
MPRCSQTVTVHASWWSEVDGLFDEQMFAGRSDPASELEVGVRRSQQQNGIDLLVTERLVEVQTPSRAAASSPAGRRAALNERSDSEP